MIASLSDVKARLSEYIRKARINRETVVITVDAIPTAELRPIEHRERRLSEGEVVLVNAFVEGVRSKLTKQSAFSAVDLIGEDRR